MPDSLIPLARFLQRAKDAGVAVRELPVQELYYAIKEVGLADAHELVALASPEQVRGFVDLDVWQRDRIEVARLAPWLEALVEAGPEKLLRAVNAIDPEVIALYLQRQVKVHELSTGEPVPDQPLGHFFPTPDGFFLLDVLPAGEAGKAIERLLDWLYRADLERARQIVMSAKWELDSDLEEHAYRWRSGRMSDLGYTEYYEALAIYRYLDPQSVKLDETPPAPPVPETRLPVQLAGTIDAASFFGRAVATISDENALELVRARLMLLANKAMAADLIEPGDLEAAKRVLDRTVGTLAVGLEYLARGDAERAGRALGRIGLERVFRVGFSLALQLRKLADTFVREAPTAPLLDEPEALLVEKLLAPRPAFRALREIGEAAQTLEEAARMGHAVTTSLHLSRESLAEVRAAAVSPPERVTLGALARTAAANVMLGRAPSATPLHPRDLRALPPVDHARIAAALPQLAPWLDRWLAEMNRPGALLLRYSWLR
jgi:hypothetical protein